MRSSCSSLSIFFFSWTAIRCQKFDESVAVVPTVEPSSKNTTDWCDDANAWNSDDDDEQVETKLPSAVPKKAMEKMKIDDEEEEEEDKGKSSSDEDEGEEVAVESKKKTKENRSEAFAEWKRTHLQREVKEFRSFPFYYIEIDDEETIVNEAKVEEMKKLKKQVKKLEEIEEDDVDDEGAKRPKEKYEKTPTIEHGDVVFYRFQQKIRYAPDQIIR